MVNISSRGEFHPGMKFSTRFTVPGMKFHPGVRCLKFSYNTTKISSRGEIEAIPLCVKSLSARNTDTIALFGLYNDVWYGMVWYGMVWYGMVWYGMVW